jgi:hypothetical protein
MGLNNAGLNLQVAGLTSAASHVSLHTASPGTDGSNEVTGGSYTREAVSWAAAASGSAATDANIVFEVPTGVTITHLGYWSASSGGTFYGWRALNASQTFSSAGTYTISSGNLTETVS